MQNSIKAILCDIGGVLYVGHTPIDGAIEAINKIKKKYPIRFLTNSTQKTNSQIVLKLQELGFDIKSEELITALDVTKMFLLQEQSSAEYLLSDDAHSFFDDLQNYPKKYVVVGDAQDNFNYQSLNRAFRALQDGASLIAVANNRYFKDADNRLSMDAGCFVKALEYASRKKATIIGKPSREFYHLACKNLGFLPSECMMIGDDICSDIQGAQDAGLQATLVKTGKFSEEDLKLNITPDALIDSIKNFILE